MDRKFNFASSGIFSTTLHYQINRAGSLYSRQLATKKYWLGRERLKKSIPFIGLPKIFIKNVSSTTRELQRIPGKENTRSSMSDIKWTLTRVSYAELRLSGLDGIESSSISVLAISIYSEIRVEELSSALEDPNLLPSVICQGSKNLSPSGKIIDSRKPSPKDLMTTNSGPFPVVKGFLCKFQSPIFLKSDSSVFKKFCRNSIIQKI